MTLTSEANRIQYDGDGATVSFPVTFVFWDLDDLQAILTDSSGAETTWVRGTQFTLSGGSGSTGTLTISTSPTDYTPASGETLTIKSNLNDYQSTSLPAGGPLSTSALERQLDKIVRLVQQKSETLGRAIKLKASSAYSDIDMPEPSASKSIVWNSAGTGLDNGPTSSQISAAQSYATAASNSADAAATSETNAQSYATQAEAAAYGWASVSNITASSTTLTTADARKYYKIDASSNAVTINLPSIGTNEGIVYRFEVVNNDYAITIARNGTDYIGGVNGDYALSGVGAIVDFVSDDNTPDNWLASFATNLVADEVTLTKSAATFSIKDNGVTPEKAAGAVNAQTGTTYTLVLTDDLKTVTMSNASANTLTIPTNASVAFPTGARLDVWMLGAGTTTITGDTGVTLNGVSAGSCDILAQYTAASLLKIGTDTWMVAGSITTVA